VLVECGRVEVRHRLLPARAVVYYVLGLALFSTSSYEEVIRMLVSGHSWASGWSHEWSIPTKAALFQARRRLGSEPLRALYDKAAVPLANPQVAGDFYRSWRLMGIDGLCLDLADTEANVEWFGRPPSSRGGGRGGAFPQVRVLGLAECGSHAIIDAAIGTYSQGEQTLAESVLRSLKPGMLLLADRGFFSYTLWDESRATGADLLWRLKSNAVLPVEKRYSDGSFASYIYPGTKARRNHNRPDRGPCRRVHPAGGRHRGRVAGSDLPAADHHYRPPGRSRVRSRPALRTTVGDRNRLRRTQDPSTQPRARPAVEDAGRSSNSGSVRIPVRALRDTVVDAFGGNKLRARPGQIVIHPLAPGRSAHHRQPPGFFPLTPSTTPTDASPPRSSTNCCLLDAPVPTHAWSNERCPSTRSNTPTTGRLPSSSTGPSSATLK